MNTKISTQENLLQTLHILESENERMHDILDKIEKEISSSNRGSCYYFIVDRIEEIINKYKAESEDKG